MYPSGGSPQNDEVWEEFQLRNLRGAKGKYIFRQLKNKIPGNCFSEELILDCVTSNEIAPDLKELIEEMLEEEL